MNKFTADLRERLRKVKPKRWVRFGIVSLVFLAWVVWMGNPWLLIGWLLLIDIYLTAYIPWTWWRRSDNTAVRTVMGWVDAIIYALVLVYFIFAFIGQNYNIPTSSLEKSLLVGDYLWVNKTIYGPRVPITPIHFPLAHNEMPVVGGKSYLDSPRLAYHRLPGLRRVERGDIVVFNYPQGDTVLLRSLNPDYYQLSEMLRRQGVADPKSYFLANQQTFGKMVVRPVDRRENYVKRAIGLPGERMKIRHDTIFINGQPIAEPTNVQYNYIVPVSAPIPSVQWQELGVRAEDYGSGPSDDNATGMLCYNVPLTAEARAEVQKWPQVVGPLIPENRSGMYLTDGVFPASANYGWTRSDMGELWIPKRGATLKLTLDNLPLYLRAITTYEGNDLQVRDGEIYINGERTDHYTFKMDYYWMMGDNRDRSLDSRYWGFVPEDHLIGSPMFVIASFDEDRSLTDGKIRTDRILISANPDKEKWPK